MILDLGVGFRGYHSDNARTIAVSGEPTPQQRRAWEAAGNALVAIRMGAHTVNAGKVYFAAGSFEPEDFPDGVVDAHGNMAREVLAMVKLEGMETRRPLQLSGGQRQRVALARALANEPKVLLLDEPLGALDLKLREQMQGELKSLQRALGITFVFVTHDQGEALVMADRVAIFNDGRIVQIGTPQDIYERPRSRFVADFVGSSNVLAPDSAAHLGAPAGWTSLRPEKIVVADPRTPWPAGSLGVDGTVTAAHYLGAVTRLSVETPLGRLTAAVAALNGFAEGQPVRLSWPRDAMHVMEDEA